MVEFPVLTLQIRCTYSRRASCPLGVVRLQAHDIDHQPFVCSALLPIWGRQAGSGYPFYVNRRTLHWKAE